MDRHDTDDEFLGSDARFGTLHKYLTALEQGDAETIIAILRLAERSAVVERIILLANGAFLEAVQQEHTSVLDDLPHESESAPTSSLVRLPDTALPTPKLADGRFMVRRSTIVRRWGKGLVAVFVVAFLLSGFFAIFAGRGSTSMPNGVPTDVPVAPYGPNTTYDGPMIVVGAQSGYVIALRADTGAIVWHWGGAQIVDELVHAANVVYVTTEPNRQTSKSHPTSSVTALRLRDGVQLWQTTEPQLLGYSFLAVDGGSLVVGANDSGAVYTLDASTGALRWVYTTNTGRADMLITATGGVVYVDGVLQGFSAYDERTGTLLWSYVDAVNGPAVTSGNEGPSIVRGTDGLIYYYLADLVSVYAPETPAVVTFDPATGVVRATLTMSEVGSPLWVTPDGIAYTIDHNQFCAFRIAGGVQLWCTCDVTNGVNWTLRLTRWSDTLVYSRVVDETLHPSPVEVGAIAMASGSHQWVWQGSSSLYSAANSMSLVDDQHTVYLATTHGLYAIQASTGHLMWQSLATTDLSFILPTPSG